MQSSFRRCCWTAAFLLTMGHSGMAQTPETPPVPTETVTPADVTLGGEVVMRLRSSAGGRSPQQRADLMTERIAKAVGIPGIVPADVAILYKPGGDPTIFVLGRRLLTVDKATTQGSGITKPIDLASSWARRMQQILPRVNYRPSNMPEPVIPAHPALLVTDDLGKIGGPGEVVLNNKVVARLAPLPGAKTTATERADLIAARLAHIVSARQTAGALTAADIRAVPGAKPAPVKVEPAKAATASKTTKPGEKTDGAQEANADAAPPEPPAQVTIGGTPALTASPDDAAVAKMRSPAVLANVWAKNIRAALGLPVVPPPASP